MAKWNEELIERGIRDVMKALNLTRMPSRAEVELIIGDGTLTNKIAKTGGFFGWAEKLGLEVKKSETSFSLEYEKQCCDFLVSQGFRAELTPVKFPYDVLVNGCIKIDVKVSEGYSPPQGKFFFYTCNLEHKFPKCDFLVLYGVSEKHEKKTLVIPAHKLYGKNQLSVGEKSRYDIYRDRWDLIEQYAKFYEQDA